MLRIAVQSKGRLYEDTMDLLKETGIKINSARRTLLVQSSNFPIEVLYMRDDDIPECVASGIADIGIVGENEFVERGKDANVVKRLGFSKCRLSLAIPEAEDYNGVKWFDGKKIATSYPNILKKYAQEQGINIEVHVIQGSVEIAPGIGLSDGIFDIVSSGSTLVSNKLREVETVMKSEALLIGNNTRFAPASNATCNVEASSSTLLIVPPILMDPSTHNCGSTGLSSATLQYATITGSEILLSSPTPWQS